MKKSIALEAVHLAALRVLRDHGAGRPSAQQLVKAFVEAAEAEILRAHWRARQAKKMAATVGVRPATN